MFKGKGYRMLLDCMNEPVIALDKELTIGYCNAGYARWVNRSMDEIKGCKLLDVQPEIADSSLYLTYLEVLGNGLNTIAEANLGDHWWLQRIYSYPHGIFIISQEINDCKRYEEAIKGMVGKYRAVLDECGEAIILFDAYTTEILEVNRAAEEIFGYGREGLLGMPMGDLSCGQTPYTREEFMRWLRLSSDVKAQSVDWKGRDAGGREFWMSVRARRMMIDDEMRILAFIRDITPVRMAGEKLLQARDQYESLFEYATDIIFVHDLGGNFISVNPAAERITGYSQVELTKLNIQDLADEESLKLLRGFQYQRLSVNQSISYDVGITTKWGHQVYLEVSIWPVYKAGKPVAVQGIARNVTRRRNELKRLKIEERQLSALIQDLPDATLAIDLEGKVVIWNEAMENLTGIKAEQMLGKGNHEYALAFYNSRRPIMVDLVLRPDEVKQHYSVMEIDNYTVISEFATPYLRGEGHHLWGRAMPWYDENGRLLGAIECLRDITERYHILQDTKQRAARLAALADFASEPLMYCNLEGTVIFANEEMKTLLGYQSEELEGLAIGDLLAESSPEEFRKYIQSIEKPRGKLSWRGSIVFSTHGRGPILADIEARVNKYEGSRNSLIIKVVNEA